MRKCEVGRLESWRRAVGLVMVVAVVVEMMLLVVVRKEIWNDGETTHLYTHSTATPFYSSLGYFLFMIELVIFFCRVTWSLSCIVLHAASSLVVKLKNQAS